MNQLVPYVRAAGVVQWIIAAANVFIPAKLQYAENIARMSRIVRQVFIVHAAYIVGVLVGFGALCWWVAPELAAGGTLGRAVCAFLAVFWGARVPIQLFYYDDAVRRQNRLAHVGFSLAFGYLAGVFTTAAFLGGAR